MTESNNYFERMQIYEEACRRCGHEWSLPVSYRLYWNPPPLNGNREGYWREPS